MEKINSILKKLNSCDDKCKSIILDRGKGIIPRWIGGETEKPDLMVIGLNPGKCDTTERFLYKKFMTNEASLIYEFTNHCLLDPGSNKNNYLVKLTDLFVDIFGTDFINKIYITNLVKCESKINGEIDSETKEHCYHAFLQEEIEIVRPKVILALHKATVEFLRIHNYLNVEEYTHPSALGKSAADWNKQSPKRMQLINNIRVKLGLL